MPSTFLSLTSVWFTLLALFGVAVSMVRAAAVAVGSALRKRRVEIRGGMLILAVTGVLCVLSDVTYLSDLRPTLPEEAVGASGRLGYFPTPPEGDGHRWIGTRGFAPSVRDLNFRVTRVRVSLATLLGAVFVCGALRVGDRARRARDPAARPLLDRYGIPLLGAAGAASTALFWAVW